MNIKLKKLILKRNTTWNIMENERNNILEHSVIN